MMNRHEVNRFDSELQQVVAWYDVAVQLETDAPLADTPIRLSPRQLEYVFRRCMDEVTQHVVAAGYRLPKTAHEVDDYSHGYYIRLQQHHNFTQLEIPRLLDALSATWYGETKTH